MAAFWCRRSDAFGECRRRSNHSAYVYIPAKSQASKTEQKPNRKSPKKVKKSLDKKTNMVYNGSIISVHRFRTARKELARKGLIIKISTHYIPYKDGGVAYSPKRWVSKARYKELVKLGWISEKK